MKYNVYIENIVAAVNYLNINDSKVRELITGINASGFLLKNMRFFYIAGGYNFNISIYTNTYQSEIITLWDYCMENNLYDYCQSPPIGGGVVISPKFLKMFGEDCTSTFIDNLLPF